MRRRPLVLNTALGAVLIGVAVTAVILLTGSDGDETSGTTVRSSTAQIGTVSATVAASGQVGPVRSVDVSFDTSGTIATVDVGVGQTVTAGQQLGTLDDGDARNALDRAYTLLAEAEDALDEAESAETVAADNSVAAGSGGSTGGGTVSVSSAEAAVSQAEADVQDAEAAVAATTLTAPIGGLVTAVTGSVGSSAGASGGAAEGGTSTTGAFVTIADVSGYTIAATFAEADIAAVAVGQPATVTFPAVDDVTATATVTSIAPTASSTDGVVSYAATITLEALPEGIRLGQTAQISVVTAAATEVLTVPSAAISDDGDGGHSVTVIGADDARTVTAVEIGVEGDVATEIVSGLSEGDEVLVSVDTAVGSTSTDQQQGGPGGFGGAGGFPAGGPPSGGFGGN